MSLSDAFYASAAQVHAMSPWAVLLLKTTLLLTVAWLLVRLAIGYVRLTSLMQDSEIAPDDVVAKARSIANLLGCRRAVQIRIGRHFSVPFLYGLRTPVIVLPQRMCEAGYREQLPGILAHELVHVRSSDYAWNAVLQAVSMLLCFHPLAWRMGFAHRAACDSVCGW